MLWYWSICHHPAWSAPRCWMRTRSPNHFHSSSRGRHFLAEMPVRPDGLPATARPPHGMSPFGSRSTYSFPSAFLPVSLASFQADNLVLANSDGDMPIDSQTSLLCLHTAPLWVSFTASHTSIIAHTTSWWGWHLMHGPDCDLLQGPPWT